jgi:hypothetical protein
LGGYATHPQAERAYTWLLAQCLPLHPVYRHSPEAQHGLNLLIGRETREAHTLGFETARLLGAEPARGLLTYFPGFDLAQVLSLCARIIASPDDERVAEIVNSIKGEQGVNGLWTNPLKPQMARWVILELLLSFGKLDQPSDWLSQEPHTVFQSYPRRNKRY